MKRCGFLLFAFFIASLSSASTFVRHADELPDWAVKYGGEFWKRPAAPAGPDLADVVERVSLAFAEDEQGGPCVRTPAYGARFTESGFLFSAHGPKAGEVASIETAFRTVAVRQGGAVLCQPGELNWVVFGNTAQACLDPAAPIIQHCEATRGGVEVAWVVGTPLNAIDELTIEADVGGLEHAAETKGGHHFADEDGRARVRVGEAEAVDSSGRRWELAVRLVGGRLNIVVPAVVLAQADYPLAIDPAVSAEYGLDNLLVSAPAYQDQIYVKTVWGGTNYLAVWQDDRGGDWSDYEYNIFGSRISAAGQVVDPYGIAICVKPWPQQEPGVGWNGTSYVVAWQDGRSATNYLIYGARVGTDGSVLDPDGVLIGTSPTNRNQYSPWVTTRTGSVLVVWEDLRAGQRDVYGRLVGVDGVPIGSSAFFICNQTNHQEEVSAAWGETNYLVAWEDLRNDHDTWDYDDVYGARVGPDGTLLDTSSLAVGVFGSSYQHRPRVAWGGTNFLVVWEDSRNSVSSGYDVYGARVSSSGQVIDPSPLVVCNNASNQGSPSVAWGGTNFFAVWSDLRRGNTSDLYAARISHEGRVLDSNGMAICSLAEDQAFPSVAWNGSQFLVAWQTYTHADDLTHIFAERVSETGGVLDAAGFRVSKSGNYQWESDAAWGRTNWLVVWRDNLDETTSDIRGARVGSAGTVLDPAGITICAATNWQTDPSVAWGGTNFLVVWADERNLASNAMEYADIYAARVSSAGQVVDPNGIVLCTNLGPQAVPDVAGGTNGVFLIVWEDYLTPPEGGNYRGDIGGSRVNNAGTVLDPGYGLIPISTATNNQYGPEVAAGPTNFLVVWHDRRNGRNYSIYAARVDSARNVLDPNAILVGAGSTNSLDPDVAWGGTNFFVVWADYRNSAQYWSDIYGGRVSAGGAVLDGTGGFAICTETNIQSDPVVGWSGTNFFAMWLNEDLEPNTLWGSRIDSSGNVLDSKDPGGFELFTNRVRRVDAALAPRSNGLFLVTYSKLRAEGFNTFRAHAALLDLSPPALRVISPHGTGAPGIGTNFYVHGTPVSCVVLDSPVTGGDTQWVCSGWMGTGSAPSGSGTNTGVFALDNDSSVTWLWTTNYRLTVTIGGRGSANWTNGWVKYASNVTVTAANGSHFYFNGWQGNVPAGSTNLNPLTVTMSVPRLATVNFAPYLATNRVPHWWLAEHGLATNDAAAMADADNDFQRTWEEWIAFTDPTNRESSFVLFTSVGVETTITVTISGTLTDRVYDVLSGTNLNTAGTWTARGLNVPGTGSNLTFVISNASPQAFHRFSVTLP